MASVQLGNASIKRDVELERPDPQQAVNRTLLQRLQAPKLKGNTNISHQQVGQQRLFGEEGSSSKQDALQQQVLEIGERIQELKLEHVASADDVRTSQSVASDILVSQYALARAHVANGRIKEVVNVLEHLVAIRNQEFIKGFPSKLTLQQELARAYSKNGQVDEAVKLFEYVVARQGKERGKDNGYVLALHYELARACIANGQVKRAINILEQLVMLPAELLAESHSVRLASQYELAKAYHNNGQFKVAVRLLELLNSMQAKVLAVDHPNRLASQYELARAYKADGRIQRAVDLFERVFARQKKVLGQDNPALLAFCHELARAYCANGQANEAVKLLEHTIDIQTRTIAEDHPDRLASQHELSRAYHRNGQIQEAVKLLENVVRIQTEVLSLDHPLRVASQHELARAYHSTGKVKEAVELLERVVTIEEVLAQDHPLRLASQYELARAHHSNGQIQEAVKLLESVVRIQARMFPHGHLLRVASQHELARAYHAIGKVKEAIELLERVVVIEEVLAQDHPLRLASQYELAKAYHSNGQIQEAAKLLESVVRIQAGVLQQNHPLRLASQHELARAYHATGKVKEAVKLLESVVAIEEVLAQDHPLRVASQYELARAYSTSGYLKEEVELLERVVAIESRTLQNPHPLIETSRRQLVRAYRANGQVEEAVNLTGQHWELPRQRRPSRSNLKRTAMVDFEPTISNLILKAVEGEHLIGNAGTNACDVEFHIQWDPEKFVQEQFSGEDVSFADALGGAITLTGTGTHAQALTSRQYLLQTWPSTAEFNVFQILKDAILHPKADPKYHRHPNGALLGVTSKPDGLLVHATGTFDSVLEIGDLFAWLGAALRSSPRNHDLMYSIPFIYKLDKVQWKETRCQINCDIDFYFKEIKDGPLSFNGRCWHNMFQNPVIVPNYPIRESASDTLGIDMPLEMMAALVGTKRITTFSGNTFMKSFNAMLLLTEQMEGLSKWHFLYNKENEHFSYTDPRVRKTCSSNLASELFDLERTRHVIGWCSSVQSFVGSPRAEYSIQWSRLERPHQGCAFEKVSISGGKIISASVSLVVGKKDKPAYLSSRQHYIERLKWLEMKSVVLYDIGDRRAWLVDGVSTLAHLLRVSLKRDASGKFKHLLKLDNENMHEDGIGLGGSDSAIKFLTNPHNQNLVLYGNLDEPDTCFRVKDRVDQIYHVIEQVITYQSQVDSEDGIGFRVRRSPRTQLEGFDFMDLAVGGDPFWPRIHTLCTGSTGWVDLTRALHAVTLFGQGFGDLLKPADGIPLCSSWQQAPEGQDYLIASSSSLKEILEMRGDDRTHPWRLIDDIYWLCPDKAFESCQCSSAESSSARSCNRIQVLSSSSFTRLRARTLKSPSSLPESGAIIFGHRRNPNSPRADSREQTTGLTLDEENLADSGLGSSIGSPSDSSVANNTGNETPQPNTPTLKKARRRRLLSMLGLSK